MLIETLNIANIRKFFEFFDPTYENNAYLCIVKINKHYITFKKLKIMKTTNVQESLKKLIRKNLRGYRISDFDVKDEDTLSFVYYCKQDKNYYDITIRKDDEEFYFDAYLQGDWYMEQGKYLDDVKLDFCDTLEDVSTSWQFYLEEAVECWETDK